MTKTTTKQIPDGWKETTLAEHMTFSNGRTSPDRQYGGAYPVYGANGIIGYSEETNSDEDTLIIGRVGAYCGSVYYSTTLCWITDNAIRGQARNNANPHYMFYLLGTLHLNSRAGGSGHPLLNQSTLNAIEVVAPEKPEQEAIADVLSSLDDKIELLRKQNETLEAIAQTIFKEWFVNFNFPDKNGKPYKDSGGQMTDSELGEIPKGWKVESLYDIAKYINGGAFKQADFSPDNSGLPVIKIIELKDGITNNTRYTENSVPEKIFIDNRDVLFSWSGSPETSIDIFVWHLGKGVLNQHTFKVVAHRIIDESWVYNVLKYHKPLFINIAKQKQTTGLGHVTIEDLRRNKVARPKDDVLSKYDSLAKPLFDKYYLSLREVDSLSKLRDTLLPKLMSGQVRVEV